MTDDLVKHVASAASDVASAHVPGPVFIGGTSLAVAAGLAAVVVMLMTKPKDDKEFAVALISTVMSSLCGGAAVVLWFGLVKWVLVTSPTELYLGFLALGGIFFACGLPGWLFVRLLFNTMEKAKGKTLEGAIHDIKHEVTS